MSEPKFYGKFYSVKHRSETKPCRSILEISLDGCFLAELRKKEPDLIVVMMNPGGSHPKGFKKDTWFRDPRFVKPQMIEAQPDATQFQIVEVMKRMKNKPKHARILNLTSYCQAKSKRLFDLGCEFLIEQSHFRQKRKSANDISKIPILFAWGVDKRLGFLKELIQERGCGVLKSGTTDCYRHPLPRSADDQKRWIELAIKALDKNKNVDWNTGKHINE